MKVHPAMLLKTNAEKMLPLGYPTISMKIKGLIYSTHDLYEKKGAWLKPQVESREGGAPKTAVVLSPRLQPSVEGQAGATRRCTTAGWGTDNKPHGRIY
jgi:hypothetical protein